MLMTTDEAKQLLDVQFGKRERVSIGAWSYAFSQRNSNLERYVSFQDWCDNEPYQIYAYSTQIADGVHIYNCVRCHPITHKSIDIVDVTKDTRDWKDLNGLINER